MPRRQLSGAPATAYAERFTLTADGLKRALNLLGCEVGPDSTGMAYAVWKDDVRIGGPDSRQELAMLGAIHNLETTTPEASNNE